MSFSAKNQKTNELDLESDLLLTEKELSALKSHSLQNNMNLEEYIDFLEDIGAFESGKGQNRYFEDEFIL